MNSLYLILDIIVFAGPFLLSFDKKVAFYKKWKFVFPAVACMMVIFIPWDGLFTYYGIWGFNDNYILGPSLAYLPLEEWLFFPATHYAVIFIYECLNAYIKKDLLRSSHRNILMVISLVGLIALFHPYQLYSILKMGGAALFALIMLFVVKPDWLSRFTITFLISLIPFLIMNSILTGSFLEEEIVWYNPHHIFNIRIGTIPVEDFFYNLFMLMTTIFFYEWFKTGNFRGKLTGTI